MQPIIATTEHNRQNAMAALDRYIANARTRAEGGIERIMSEVPKDQIIRGGAIAFSALPSADVCVSAPFTATMHDNALTQFADKAQIPMGYVRHLQDEARAIEVENANVQSTILRRTGSTDGYIPRTNWAANLLAQSLNEHATHKLSNDRYLVRGVATQVRAFLSDKFRRVDCRPGLDALLQVSNSVGALVSDAVVTDIRASVRIIVPKVYEISPGEFVVFGVSWKNSDFGRGAQDLSMFALRLWCYNGAVLESGVRQIHLGGRLSDDLSYSERTMRLDAAATSSAIRDTAKAFLSDVKVAESAALLTAAASEGVDAKAKLADLRKRLGKGIADKVGEAFNRPDVEELPPGNTTWRWSNAISWVAKQPDTNAETRLDLENEAGAVLLKSARAA